MTRLGKYSHPHAIRKAAVIPVIGVVVATGIKSIFPEIIDLPGVTEESLIGICIVGINYIKNIAKHKFFFSLPF